MPLFLVCVIVEMHPLFLYLFHILTTHVNSQLSPTPLTNEYSRLTLIRLIYFEKHSLATAHVVLVVQEGCHVFVPAGQILGYLHLDELGEPSHVFDLLLLQLEVGVEAAVVELAFEALREFAAGSLQHYLIDGGAGGFGFIALVAVGNHLEHIVIARAVKSNNEGIEVVDSVETCRVVGVKVADLAHVLLTFVLTLGGVHTVAERVANNLDALQVRLKLKEISHDLLGHASELSLGELIEVVEPDLAYTQLNLLKGVVSHGLADELGVDFHALIGLSGGGDLIKEFTEVASDGQINKHVLVKRCVVISFDGLDVLKFGESAEGITGLEQLLQVAAGLETFNNEDNVINLISVQHHG